MAKVTGIGGVFFKLADPSATRYNNGMKIELWEPADSAYDEMIGDARTM